MPCYSLAPVERVWFDEWSYIGTCSICASYLCLTAWGEIAGEERETKYCPQENFRGILSDSWLQGTTVVQMTGLHSSYLLSVQLLMLWTSRGVACRAERK